MQKLMIILFATAVILKPAFPLVDYFVNFDYIAKELCINKDKKNLECNGKCQLKTKLAEASEPTEKNVPSKKVNMQPEVLFCAELKALLPRQPMPVYKREDIGQPNHYAFASDARLFRPPACVNFL